MISRASSGSNIENAQHSRYLKDQTWEDFSLRIQAPEDADENNSPSPAVEHKVSHPVRKLLVEKRAHT